MAATVPVLCADRLALTWLAAIDGTTPALTGQCPEEPTQRVRFDRHELGVFGVLVAEVCAGHAVIAEARGALHLGEIPRHAVASP